MGRSTLALLALCTLATSGAAEPLRFETAIGYRSGGLVLDTVDVGGVRGGHVDAGIRLHRLLLFAEYDLYELAWPSGAATAARDAPSVMTGSSGALEHRFAGNVRYAYERFGGRNALDLWIEGGAGVEHYVWDIGGVLTRPDFSIALGASSLFAGTRRYGGLSFAVRFTFAHRDDVAPDLACGGPCDSATRATSWDHSIMWDLSMVIGR